MFGMLSIHLFDKRTSYFVEAFYFVNPITELIGVFKCFDVRRESNLQKLSHHHSCTPWLTVTADGSMLSSSLEHWSYFGQHEGHLACNFAKTIPKRFFWSVAQPRISNRLVKRKLGVRLLVE